MRFLFVYQDFAKPAQDLITRLGIKDVQLIIARRGETAPNDAERETIDGGTRARAALCQVHRTYKKFIEDFVDLEYIAKQFREGDKQLEAWLLGPAAEQEHEYPLPSVIFMEHAKACSTFRLAKGALDAADQLDETRRPFAKKAADLLLRHVRSRDTGAMREWKAKHGVEFAPNGKVKYKWTAPSGKQVASEWHLKEGDKTTAERAARVYFDCCEDDGEVEVVIFHVGPHPPDGEYEVHFES